MYGKTKNPHRQRGFEHTYILNWKKETKEQKPSQGEWFWVSSVLRCKNPSQGEGFWNLRYIHTFLVFVEFSLSMRFKTPLPVRVFWRADSKPISLWWFLHFRQILMHVCMYVCMYVCSKPPLPVRDFFYHTYMHKNEKWSSQLSRYVCKTPLPVRENAN